MSWTSYRGSGKAPVCAPSAMAWETPRLTRRPRPAALESRPPPAPLQDSVSRLSRKRPLAATDMYDALPEIRPVTNRATVQATVQVATKLTKSVNRATRAQALATTVSGRAYRSPVTTVVEARDELLAADDPGGQSLRERLARLAREAVGSKSLKAAAAKRERARRRQACHSWTLRASRGSTGVLEQLSASDKQMKDYQRRLAYFWDFAARHGLRIQEDRGLDNAATDWADLEFLCGEGPEVGEKLLAALEKWALTARERRCIQVPRFRHTLRSWRRNSPKKSRLPMPEEHMWIITGTIGAASLPEEALFMVTLYDTYLRPTACHCLMDVDIVAPMYETGSHVILVSPFEREKATKGGYYDERVILDGDLLPILGKLLKELAEQRGSESDAHEDDPVGLWSFKMRTFIGNFKGAIELNGLTGMETVY